MTPSESPPLDLQELEELERAAMPESGEGWITEQHYESRRWLILNADDPNHGCIGEFWEWCEDEARLTVAARNALPSLLARVRDLEEENQQLRRPGMWMVRVEIRNDRASYRLQGDERNPSLRNLTKEDLDLDESADFPEKVLVRITPKLAAHDHQGSPT